MVVIRERKHRLPKEFYRGEISVAFTLCLKRESVSSGFLDSRIVDRFTDILTSVVSEADCYVPVYCFMPDHQHLIVSGRQKNSDIWSAIAKYKQKTGFWLSKNTSLRWQKDFYDHAIRSGEDVAAQAKYILDNPVRKGLAESWEEYPFKGSVGCRLEDVLNGIT